MLPLNPPTAINCMCFNHNSNLLVTGGVDGMIRLFGTSIMYRDVCLFSVCVYLLLLYRIFVY